MKNAAVAEILPVTSPPAPTPNGAAAESAKAAGLRYVSDDSPGFKRRKTAPGFVYASAEGRSIRDPEQIRRIKSLAIPPAWRDVWICPIANGHLQATGRDAKGRKQHCYHPRWREVRDRTKYEKMLAFARQLPEIRRRVRKDLALPGLPRQKILAAVVSLLETGMMRVGNKQYTRQNGSFGLATLRSRHVRVSGPKMRFEFRGKSGVQQAFDLSDRRLARIIKQCQELPGHELFQYIDDEGERCTLGSADVNDYLRSVAGDDFSSKDFRTWAGTVLAAGALAELPRRATKKKITRAIESVAKQLGNTVAVCRKCYIHPAVLEAYSSGSLVGILNGRKAVLKNSVRRGLNKEESGVIALLERSLKANGRGRNPELRRQLRRSLHRAVAERARDPQTRRNPESLPGQNRRV